MKLALILDIWKELFMTDKKIEKLADKFIQKLKILTAELTDNNISLCFLADVIKKAIRKICHC